MVALFVVVALAGCRREGDENLGLASRRRAAAVDVRALDRPGELEKSLALPSTEVEKGLGAHRLAASTKLALSAGTFSDTLEETFHLELDGKGGVHLLRENSHGTGNEAIAAGGQLYVRPRYGRFVRRAPEGDEVERLRDETQGLGAGYLAVLGRFATRTDGGAGDFHGRPVRKVTLALATTPGPFEDADPAHAWRKTIEVSALEGEVWIDAATGAPLHATLEAKYKGLRDGKPIAVALHHQADVEAIGAVAPIAAPADALPSPARARPLLDKQALLEGLAPGVNKKAAEER